MAGPPFLFPLLPLLFPCLFISIAAQSNTTYPSCHSYNSCNGLNISYPFWRIDDDRTQYCGYQAFGINCSDINGTDRPMMKFGNNSYYVRQIFYEASDIILVDENVFPISPLQILEGDRCPTVRHNIDFHSLPLNFSPFNANLSFHYNCNRIPDFATEIPCPESDSGGRKSCVNVMRWDTEDFDWSNYSCGDHVVKTVFDKDLPDRETLGLEYGVALGKGFELRWWGREACGECEKSNGRCGYNNSTRESMCFCSDGTTTTDHCNKGTNLKTKLIIGCLGVVLGMVLIFITFCIIKPSSSNFIAIFKRKTEDDKNVEVFIMKYGSLGMKRYNYADIKKITNSFHVKLGQGGFGTVFKGKLSDGRPVAVKVLNTSKASGQEFINEVASIGRTSHVNIVTLLGFSFDHKKRALIYEYMPNGSLEKYIYRHVPLKTSENLGVEKLYEVALGIARGLDYLHRGCNTRILHLDIKPHNILLDEDFCPKIADFGLAKLYSRKESIVSMLEARGTIGYIAPEVFNRNFGGVSNKSDVYSYGMLILEMVGGRKNVDVAVGSGNTSEIYFPYWVYNRLKKDEILLDGVTTIEENDYARKMTIVGLWCIQANPVQRPSTSKVIEMLEGSMEELEMPPKPFFSSPPRSPITTFNISQEESQDHCSSTKNVPTWSLVSPSLNFFIYATYIINQLVEVVLSTISKTMAGPPFLFPLLPLLFPCLFISIAAQSNPTCPSSEFCGEISIKYPFWKIDDDQTQHCGYQGFGINCSTINEIDHPVMKIGNNSYYVRQIIYDVRRVILIDDYVFPIEPVSQPNYPNSCPTVRHNIDFHSLPLNFTEYNVNLSFHFNCNGTPNFATEIPCPGSNSGGRKSCVNVMRPETEDFDWSTFSCTEDVVKTVLNHSDLYAGTLGREYGFALGRGFELKWGMLEGCGKCEKSNGRCGYNNSTQESMCFCPDGRTTTDYCNKGTFQFYIPVLPLD
ncbi:hypothetical protein OSB04_014723 [Centaurea solstitialis]|uniref:non-specific serine/threonine protein kinase n=1 Tax=Centaurea solstitialis TaxID=347529 RepID=A0AA38SXT4_9ASTR|nr:hypothetical protein OSB04_014723 [Centaurea solstitialis]